MRTNWPSSWKRRLDRRRISRKERTPTLYSRNKDLRRFWTNMAGRYGWSNESPSWIRELMCNQVEDKAGEEEVALVKKMDNETYNPPPQPFPQLSN
jgi:hypothetical protein